MKKLPLLLIILFLAMIAKAQKPVVYLIPGQGSDHRLYKNLEIDTSFEVRHIEYFTPEEAWNMQTFAYELSKQIDTTEKYYLIGVSLGGMLISEMLEYLEPEKAIIVSSAKSREELPLSYRFQRDVPINKLISGHLTKNGAKLMQPLYEPDRNKEKETFVNMMNDKDPLFLKRTVNMIVNWDRTEEHKNIIHIHGDADHTIPIRNVDYSYRINGGSHMMMLTMGKELSGLINYVLRV